PTGMFYSKRAECTCREDFERLPVKQHTTGIVRLRINVLPGGPKPSSEVLLGKRCPHLQTKTNARPACRHRQPLHHGLRRRHEEDRLFGLGEAPQDRTSPTRDFVRWLQLVERQSIQPWKNKHIARGIQGVDDATKPLGPMLILSKKDDAVASGTSPLRQQMESHHA